MDLETLVESGGRDYILSEADNRIAIVTNDGQKYVRIKGSYGGRRGERIEGEYNELYNLKEDPYEYENCYTNSSSAANLEKCRRIYARHKESIESVLFYDEIGKTPPWFLG